MSPDNQPNTTKICPTCGTRLGINATRCSVCGSNLAPSVAVSSAKPVTGPRIPEVTLSLPVVFGLAILLLVIGAGVVFAVLKSMGDKAPITAAVAATITPTASATATASLTPTITVTPSPISTWTLEPPLEYKVASGDHVLLLQPTSMSRWTASSSSTASTVMCFRSGRYSRSPSPPRRHHRRQPTRSTQQKPPQPIAARLR